MKSYVLVIGIFVFVSLAVGVAFFVTTGEDHQEQVTSFVTENEEMLRQKIEDSNMNKKKIGAIEGVETIRKPKDSMLVFECGAEGLVNSSLQWGFYFTMDNELSNEGTNWTSHMTLEEKEDGYYYEEGDDFYYTEKICDNFYYYMAGN